MNQIDCAADAGRGTTARIASTIVAHTVASTAAPIGSKIVAKPPPSAGNTGVLRDQPAITSAAKPAVIAAAGVQPDALQPGHAPSVAEPRGEAGDDAATEKGNRGNRQQHQRGRRQLAHAGCLERP